MALIAVSGAIANKPFNGGEAWVRLNWILGFMQLGHEVVFVEQIQTPDESSATSEVRAALASKVRYFTDVMGRFNLQDRAALVDEKGRRVWGLGAKEVEALLSKSTAIINISGHLQSEAFRCAPAIKVYIDLDPGFTQFWHHQGNAAARLEGHDYYFTVGENIGTRGCDIPTDGIVWRPVRQPVVLDQFPVVESPAPVRFTTIGSWRGSFGPVQAGDKVYGQKVHEFRKFVDLPRIVNEHFEIALDIHPAEVKDLALLRENDWRLSDPVAAAGDPARFRSYVQQSGAEFSVAQGMYVDANSGWFSDRTVRYLASGKPALVQDTGFSGNLPVGEGLIPFRTLDEAAAGARSITDEYRLHCRAARRVAEKCFDSDLVLSNLLDDIGVSGRTNAHQAHGSSVRAMS